MTVQPEAPPIGPGGVLNDVPMGPDGRRMPMNGGQLPPMPQPPHAEPLTTDQVDRAIGKATAEPEPTIDEPGEVTVDLPAGWLTPEGLLVTKATVRELNGYDEERLSRVDMQKNGAAYVTELLVLGVEELGGQKPTKKILQELLIGDRDALVLGIRTATYGNEVEFKLTCPECDTESAIGVLLDEDVDVVRLEDPLVRRFDVKLRNGGTALVALLTGVAQEAVAADFVKKTTAEINTVMLAKSVVAINGKPVMGRNEDVQMLSAADRGTITDFIAEHQPGPQLNKEIPVPCAVCGNEFRILLGLPNLFRF
jgi:hypothetical protein